MEAKFGKSLRMYVWVGMGVEALRSLSMSEVSEMGCCMERGCGWLKRGSRESI